MLAVVYLKEFATIQTSVCGPCTCGFIVLEQYFVKLATIFVAFSVKHKGSTIDAQ